LSGDDGLWSRMTKAQNPGSNISLIIPVYNDGVYLRRLLKQVNRLKFKDILVIDGGSSDDSRAVVQPYSQAKLLTSERGRGRQIAKGLERARGDYIWILHADSIVPDGAVAHIEQSLRDDGVALGCFRLRYDLGHMVLRCFAWFSRFDSPLTSFGDQGFFFRKADMPEPDMLNAWPLLEDVALRRILLRTHKGKVHKSSLVLHTSARRFVQHGILKTQLINGWILLRCFCGVDPKKLFREYYGD